MPFDPFVDKPEVEIKKETKVSEEESTGKGISITHKAGVTFDAPWIVFHADSPKQALGWYGISVPDSASNEAVVTKLFQVVAGAAHNFQEAYGEAVPAAVTAPAKPHLNNEGKVENAPAPAAPQTNGQEPYKTPPVWMGPAPACPHGQTGVRKFVSKVGQYGPWAAWGCAAPQGAPETCAQGLIFVKKPKGQ